MQSTTDIKHLVDKFSLHMDVLDHSKNLLKRQIDHTDNKIDKLVYELYDLTLDEIKIVEGE